MIKSKFTYFNQNLYIFDPSLNGCLIKLVAAIVIVVNIHGVR